MPQTYTPGEPFVPEMSLTPKKIQARDRLIRVARTQYGEGLDPIDLEILNTAPSVLVGIMKTGQPRYTCQQVMRAYIKAACRAHSDLNCLTEILFEEGMEEAKRKDAERDSGKDCVGPFWGLPSSFKDTYNIVGVDTSLGCSPHCYQPTQKAQDEGGLVKLFRQGGGIPFCKTNVPQTLLAFESSNPIFGTTSNPYDRFRGPGGSSGGEAALVAVRGTPVGWGSDIGGSLRIPAHYSGICGLKPVKGRWPMKGDRPTIPGFEAIKVSVGPLARNVDDLIWASKSITQMAMERRERGGEVTIPLPWREVELPKKLRVGWFTESGAVHSSPACSRAVHTVVDKLKAAGHFVEEFAPPDPTDVIKIFAGLTSADGYRTLLSNIGPDPMEPSMRLVTLGPKLPSFIKSLAVWAIRSVLGDEAFATTFEASTTKTTKDFWQWTHQKQVWEEHFNRKAWGEGDYDMIICPVQAVPALKHRETEFLSPIATATIMFNICDSTVGVLPVTRVDKDTDKIPAEGYPTDHTRSKLLEKRVYGAGGVYDPVAMHGLPVGVQVVGRAFEEEKVLKMMKVCEDLVGFKRKGEGKSL